ncbi:MAG: ferritin [Candidatus Omnitrophota bacterium]
MKINSKVEKAINNQINKELYSSYLYLAMSAYFESVNLRGFAHWVRLQAKEEDGHAMKFYGYLFDRGGRVILSAIEAPPSQWKSALDAFSQIYSHEVKVTGYINDVLKTARQENDSATETMLDWFITEQVEEEAHAQQILEKLKMVKDSSNGLMMLDFELSQRK